MRNRQGADYENGRRVKNGVLEGIKKLDKKKVSAISRAQSIDNLCKTRSWRQRSYIVVIDGATTIKHA